MDLRFETLLIFSTSGVVTWSFIFHLWRTDRMLRYKPLFMCHVYKFNHQDLGTHLPVNVTLPYFLPLSWMPERFNALKPAENSPWRFVAIVTVTETVDGQLQIGIHCCWSRRRQWRKWSLHWPHRHVTVVCLVPKLYNVLPLNFLPIYVWLDTWEYVDHGGSISKQASICFLVQRCKIISNCKITNNFVFFMIVVMLA